jgi:hypothetical protein
MIVAELEIYHSRPIAPTRRVALGARDLPVDPPPGAGGVLLAGIVARFAPGVAAELREDLVWVLDTLAGGGRVVQPRVRHRFQQDRVGLTLSPQRLVVEAGVLSFDLEEDLGRPVQLALGALYAAGAVADPRLRSRQGRPGVGPGCRYPFHLPHHERPQGRPGSAPGVARPGHLGP